MKYYFSFTDISLNPFAIYFLTLIELVVQTEEAKKNSLKKKTNN